MPDAKKITLEDLMTLTLKADAARKAQEVAEKEVGQATRRAARKAEELKAVEAELATAKAAFEKK